MTPQRIILFLVGAAIGGLGLLAAGEWLRPVQAGAQTPGIQPGPIINNQGIVTQGQTGGRNTVINQGPQPRNLSHHQQDIISQELKKTPGTKIELIWIFKNEVVEYPQEIGNVLQRNGYEIVPLSFSNIIPEPVGISIYDQENKLTSLASAFRAAGISYSIAPGKASRALIRQNYRQ